MKALVTGATGFVGSAVVRRLLRDGHHVRVLVRATSDRRNLQGLDVQVVEGDLTQAASLQHACDDCDALFHVAADYRLWAPQPAQLYQANVEGTRAMLEAAKRAGVPRIVYTSSVATLGIPVDGCPGDENTPVALIDMIGHYKRSKFLAESLVREFAAEGLPVVIVNPSTPIGPRDIKPTPTGRIVRDAIAGRLPAYVDTGLNVVHVDDVAEGHWLAFQHGVVGERYILGGHNLSLRELLVEIADIAGRAPPRWRLPHAAVMPVAYLAEGWARLTGVQPIATVEEVRMSKKRMFFSSAKAERELGYAPGPVRLALEDAVTWFRQHQQ
ncbi:hopanoid-associated sugar epimerase [Azotobacter beijerinckii]|uniref:Dihydroflavonol-4-reductase n=1 Tax=Azotobacter beijerinckii TaxID=170623 RepID=A0A1I4FTV7_9GAMM|nr:hopanoid-associated sugar epimerase [Azotobacter beijerinckii]SFB53984.1 dihydroflavonol-4-reductase [Azotobacter beijerinckii]SFL20740.1 dihydroflavonol-4-reductase [Azotobacter beijerinckii]